MNLKDETCWGLRDRITELETEVVRLQAEADKWQTGKPKNNNPGALAERFVVVQQHSDVPEIMNFFFIENEFMECDGNSRQVRLWMRVPAIPPQPKT